MSDGGKGSKPRPFSVSQENFSDNWDKIFKKPAWDNYSDLPSPDAYKNDYQDVLSTEDCVVDALDEYKKQAQELWNDSCTSIRKKRD
jgi:hypothetical protein